MTEQQRSKTGERRERKLPRKATATYLRRAGLYYLERYNATRKSLRDLLMRRVRNSLRAHPVEGDHTPEALQEAVEALVAEFTQLGYVDDSAFARGRVRTLQLAGDSPRLMAQKLAAKGVGGDELEAALDLLADERGLEDRRELAMEAAWNYAKRRRLGPYRLDEQLREDNRDKDLARLARRGFSLDCARTVIDAEDVPL